MKPIDLINNLSQDEINLILLGHCPHCKQKIKNYKVPFGSFAPEIWATLREHGIDPESGHKSNCKYFDLIID